MCTVTYIPGQGSFLLASNRDENRGRPFALPPAVHRVHGQRLVFPRDGLAGGTWIAVNENGFAIVLLNGAFEKHISHPPYRLSRGLILLDLLTAPDPESAFSAANLQGVEPFTIVLAGHGKLVVGRWDGSQAVTERPDPASPHIWSSVTLYPQDIRRKREGWFRRWVDEHPAPDVAAVTDFHRFTGDGDTANDLRMERANGIFTNSISVLDFHPGQVLFQYLDLRDDRKYQETFSFVTMPSSRQ